MKQTFHMTDLHCHTSEGSACAKESTKDTIEKYLAYGYTSIALTNHLESHRIRVCEGSRNFIFSTYAEYVDFIYDVIDYAKRISDGRINILSGFELRNSCSGNDYLVYGLTREMAKGFDLASEDLSECAEYIRNCGGVIIQAHPMRTGMTIIDPGDVDGYEIFNNSSNWLYMNTVTQMWAMINCFDNFKILTAGNDHHNPADKPGAGILTSEPIVTDADLVRVLKNRDFSIFHPTKMNCGD